MSLSEKEKAEGWIEWDGGECPVEENTMIETRHREQGGQKSLAGDFWWKHKNWPGDIIAYRVVKPAEEKAVPEFEGGVSAVPLPDDESQPAYIERLRDKAALAALQGMMVSPAASTRVIGSEMAENAWRMADAFMAKRARRRSA